MTSAPLRLRSLAARPGFPWWSVALAAALVFVVGDNLARIRHLTRLADLPGVNVPPAIADAASPTGYALGRRSLILPRVARDSDHWVMQVQDTLAGGPWRLRAVSYDDAPSGREVHWALPLHAWLSFLARAVHLVSGRSLGVAAEQAALFSNPLLLALFLLGLIPIAARRFGSAAAALLGLGLISSYPFYLYFGAGNAEHQGAAEACALLTVFSLLGGAGGWTGNDAGAAGAPSEKQARLWFLGSAVAGGIGLWISTASEAPVLASVGCGALASFWLGRSDQSNRLRPELWRFWGIVGCTVSFVAYLLEYFPFHLGWRLEVNHPLYGLAWLGGGELLCRFGRLATHDPRSRLRSHRRAIVAAFALVAILPVVILLTGSQTFLVSDPFLWKLHTSYIVEFQGLASYLARRGYDLVGFIRLWPFALALIALGAIGRRGTSPFRKSQLALAVVPAALEFGLASQQIRWWGLASGLAIVTSLPLLALLEDRFPLGHPKRRWRLLLILLLVPGAASALLIARMDSGYTAEDVFGLAERDLADWLRLRAGSTPVNVLSTPDTTTALIYHGSLTGQGTFYWENRGGLTAAARIFAATNFDQALQLIRARHITHIVLVSWDPFWSAYVRLARGLAPSGDLPTDSFAAAVLRGDTLPPWLQAIPYNLPAHPALRGHKVWIYEIKLP